MAERRSYSDTAVATTITPAISSADTTIGIAASSGWPAGGANGPAVATIGRGTASEERIKYTSRSGGTLSGVTRGFGGTTASAHALGTPIEHTLSADDMDMVNRHPTTAGDDDHTQYMKTDGTRHDLTARHTFGAALGTPAAPTTILPDAAGSAGSAAGPARADHTHGFPCAIATTITGVNAEGAASTAARSDHDHAYGDGSIVLADLAAAVQNLLVPTGAVTTYGGTAAPTGWLMCDGSAVSRATFSALFAVIGTAYGVGDGVTTFNLPDPRGRFPLGKAAAGTGSTLGGTGGAIDHTHGLDTATSYAKLAFTVDAGANDPTMRRRAGVAAWNATHAGNMSVGGSAATGLDSGIELAGTSDTANPPFQTFNFIVKT